MATGSVNFLLTRGVVRLAENRRVKMTKKMMKDALLELLEKQPIEKITVTDICEKADVNRSTFYSYYEDIGQLLLEVEDDVLNSLPVSPDSASVDTDGRFLSALEEFFNYVRENERPFRLLIVQRDSSSFNHRLINSVMERYRKPSSTGDKLLDRYAYVYCINGVIGIMKEWINGNFSISTRDFTQMAFQMSAKAIS